MAVLNQISGFHVLTKSTAFTVLFTMVDATDGFTAETGVTVTVNISKAGAAFGAAAGTVTEIGNGIYKIALTTGDTDTNGDLYFRCTGTGCRDTVFTCQVHTTGLDVWEALTSALTTAGTIGKKLADLVVGTDSRVKVSADAHTAGSTIAAVSGGVTVTTNNDKTGYGLSSSERTSLENQVWNASVSSHTTAGSTGAHVQKDPWDVSLPGAYASGKSGKILGDLASTVDPWGVALPGAYGAGTAGKILGTNLDVVVSTRSSLSSSDIQTAVDNRLDAAGSELSAVPTTTGSLRQKLNFLFQYFRNKRTVTATTETAFKEDASTSLGTATIADDGTTFTRGELN